MRKFIKGLLLASFISFSLMMLGITSYNNIDDKRNPLQAAADESGAIKVVEDNSLKAYKSNIYDDWYSKEAYYGASTELNEDGNFVLGLQTHQLDIIDENFTKNYNDGTEELPIFELKYDSDTSDGDDTETIVLYLEFAHHMWDPIYQPYPTFFLENDAGHADITLENYYEDSEGVIESEIICQIDSTSTGSSKYSTNLMPLDSTYEYDETKGQYSLLDVTKDQLYYQKITITPNKLGYGKLKISVMGTHSGSGPTEEFTCLIHAYDEYKVSYGDIYIESDVESNYYYDNIYYEVFTPEFQNKNIPINITDQNNQEVSFAPYFPSYVDTFIDVTFTYENVTSGLNVVDKSSYLLLTFDGPGIYKMDIRVDILIDSGDSGNVSLVQKYTISFNAYTEETIINDFEVTEKNENTAYFEENSTIDFSLKTFEVYDWYEITYYLNQELIDEPIIRNAQAGTYYIDAVITDNQLGKTLNSSYEIVVASKSELYQKPKFDKNEIVFYYEDMNEDFTYPTIRINNYEYLSENATVDYELIEGSIDFELVVLSDNSGAYFNINSVAYGVNRIRVTANYGKVASTETLTLIYTTNLKFGVSKNNITIAPNSMASITAGYVLDNKLCDFTHLHNFELGVITTSELIQYSVTGGNINISSLNKSGQAVLNIVIINYEMTENGIVEIIPVTVNVTSEGLDITSEVSFAEGNIIKLILSDNKANTTTISLNEATVANCDFSFIVLNTRIANVIKTSPTTAKITAVSVGNTEIIAICTLDDGASITARATITVLDAIPTIDVSFSKEGTTAFNIYDNIKISINNNGFIFSNLINVTWYINDELVSKGLDAYGQEFDLVSTTKEFYYKFSEGIHTIKVVVLDDYYQMELTGAKDINIVAVKDLERTLSFADSEIDLILGGDDYMVNALLDGVLSNEYTYEWFIDDSKIATIYMKSGYQALIRPANPGQTVLNVIANIGQYEDKIIRAQVTINVEKLESIAVNPINEYPKPGEDVKLEVLLNGKNTFKNYTPNISISDGINDLEYEYNNSVITVKNAPKAKLRVNVEYSSLKASKSVDVTNFSFKKFFFTILPYLVVALVVSVFLFTVFKVNNNPFKKVLANLSKINANIDNALDKDDLYEDKKNVVALYSKLLKISNKLHNDLVYYYDEGIDEFKPIMNNVKSLNKIFEALIRTSNKSTKNLVIKVLNNLKENQIKDISSGIAEVIATRNKFDADIKKNMAKDQIIEKKKKKNKKSKTEEDYNLYLIENGIIYDDYDQSNEEDE